MPIRKLGSGQEVPFADFAPDQNLTTPGIIIDASNAIPTIKGYKARPSPVQIAPALPLTGTGQTEPPLGAYVALYQNGTTSLIAGTATRLFRLSAGAWTQIGSGYTATFPWVFTQFGEDVLATSAGNLNMQVANGPTGTFSNLGPGTGDPPPNNAPTVISVAGFAASYTGSAWTNSGAGVDTGWSLPGHANNSSTLAANGFLYDYPGSIVAAAALFRNQIVFKKNSTWLLTPAAYPTVWSSQVLSSNTGTWGQGCVCPMPTAISFLGTDDFYICQAAAPQRIPNSMKEWFFNTVHKDTNGNPDQLQNTSSWYDPMTAICYWHFVSQNPPFAGIPDRYVGWNSRSGRWVPGYLNTPLVVWNTQPGMQSGMYFDTNGALQQWSGVPTTMFILTGYQGDADNLTQLQKVRVSYNQGLLPQSQTLIPMHAYRMGDFPTVESAGILALDGWFSIRQTDRYHQVQLSTNGGCEIMAMAYEGRIAGVR
jgi:hypothetical protein